MPTYVYACEDTDCECPEFEHQQSMNDDPLKECPLCGEDTLYRVIQTPMFLLKLSYGEIRELGHLAARNSEKMSNDQKNMLKEKHRTKKEDGAELPSGMSRVDENKKKEQPWWKKNQKVSTKKLAKMTPTQQKKYMETGEAS